jgi:ketosteroid isomerase-like protein
MTQLYTQVRLEDWMRGPLQVFDSETARKNKRGVEAHFEAEWNGDIEATMRTIHPDDPWQVIHGFGVDVRGYDAVRDYYNARFGSWPGPAMDHFTRVTVTDTAVIFEGTLDIRPQGEWAGRQAEGTKISVPCTIVVDMRDGLVLGETVYLDSAGAQAQISGSAP